MQLEEESYSFHTGIVNMLSLRNFWIIIMHLLRNVNEFVRLVLYLFFQTKKNRAEVLFVLLSAGAFTQQKMFSTHVFLSFLPGEIERE